MRIRAAGCIESRHWLIANFNSNAPTVTCHAHFSGNRVGVCQHIGSFCIPPLDSLPGGKDTT